MRGPLAYVHGYVAPIRGRQKIPEPSRASLRFSVVVCVRTLGMASFRGQGVAGGARSASGSAGRQGYTRAQPVTLPFLLFSFPLASRMPANGKNTALKLRRVT